MNKITHFPIKELEMQHVYKLISTAGTKFLLTLFKLGVASIAIAQIQIMKITIPQEVIEI